MAAAELKLQVGLDLAFFRQQLAQLGNVAVGYQMPINIKLDRLSIQQELDRLQRNINRRKYTIDLNDTSVVSAADKVENLAAALKKLSGSIQIDFNAGGGTKPIGTVMKEMAAKLAKESKGDINEAVKKMTQMRGAAPFGAGTRSVPGFKAAAKGMGVENAFKLFFQELDRVDPQGLRKALDDGSVMMMQENREIKQKFDKIQSSAEGLAKDLRTMGEAAQATGRASLSDGGKTLYPQNYGLKIASLLGQIEKLEKELRKVSAESGVELLDNLKELSYALRATSNSFVGIAGFSDTLDATLKGFNAATQAAARATNAYTERIRRRGGVEYGPAPQRLLTGSMPGGALAVSGQQQNPYKIIEVQVRNAFNIIEDYHKRQVANFTNSYKKIIDEYHRSVLASTARLGIRGVGVTDLGTTGRPLLPGQAKAPLMLPAAGGTTPRSQMPLHAVSTGAYVGQPGFMQAPSIPPPMGGGGAPPAPPTPPGGGRGGRGGGMGAFPNISLPGAGLISELGGEFAMAAKQVLLFGTAYKALAFLTDFPSKVGEAVGQLQTFRNTLQAITPNANEFQKSNQFILDTVAKYNTPLQSARDGFTNLYASMEPAGFKGDEIRNIFTGISQGAATFGMSADKVDRVNYAFAQMASKGQVMSEELKGQLGDVLPGAVAIFAEAAGFTGPEAMVEFTKAMEAGRYKGEAMKQLLINVGIVMKDKFAKGAEGAAQNFQGQMNAMANATKKLYEAFEPAGNLFASKVIAPFTKGLIVITDGFNAFFTGVATKTAGGFALSQELEKLRPTIKGIMDNITQLMPVLQSFATTLLGLGKILLQIAGNPFVGYLLRVYLAVLPLTMAIQALNLQALIPMIASFLRAIPAFIAFSKAAWNGASRTVALRIAMQATGQTATIAGGQVALLSNTLKTAFVGTVVGAVVIGIGMIIERIMTLSSKMEEAKGNALRLQDSIKGMSKTELQVEENKLGKQGALLQGLQREASGQRYALLNKEQEEMVMKLAPGSITRVTKAGKGRNKLVEVASGLKAIGGGLAAIDVTMLPAIEQKIQSLRQNIDSARLTLNASDQNTSLNLAPITGAGGDPEAAKAAAAALSSQQALADKLSSDQTKTDIERQKTLFENEKSMINMAYDLREARANSFQKETIRFQKELFNIEMERQKAVLDANSAVTKAQGAVAGGTGGATGLLQGSTGISSAAHFDVRRQDGGYISPQQARALFEASVAKQLQLTSTYGPRKAPVAGASTFHRGVDLAGPANTPLNLAQGYSMVGAGMKGGLGYTASVRGPQGEMYDVGHLQQPKAGVPSGKPTGRQKRVALAGQQTENALQDTKVKITLAEAEALKKAEIAMVNYISSIAPVAEQDLQNQLLGKRIELMQSGVPEVFAETQMKIFEAQEKVRMAGEELDLTNQKQVEAYEKLKQSLPGYIALLEDAAVKQQQLGFTKTMKDLGDRVAMARALTPEAEMRTRLQQQGYAGAQLETLFETEKATAKAEELKTQMQGVASTIGDAFSTAFQGIINGSVSAQEALGNFFQSVGQSFVKMAMDIIAKQMVMIVLGFLMKALGLSSGGGLGSAKDNMAQYAPLPAAANGAMFSNGIAKFATGGIVNGPTLFPFADGGAMQMGLMGEAGPEAIMPLQRGSDGSLGVRAAMGGNGMGGSSSSVLNMSFETSTINGVEYVSRDQLELAMAQTRRQASRDGANKGMAMTLDKIQQSPQTRRRIGM